MIVLILFCSCQYSREMQRTCLLQQRLWFQNLHGIPNDAGRVQTSWTPYALRVVKSTGKIKSNTATSKISILFNCKCTAEIAVCIYFYIFCTVVNALYSFSRETWRIPGAAVLIQFDYNGAARSVQYVTTHIMQSTLHIAVAPNVRLHLQSRSSGRVKVKLHACLRHSK